ncbi:MAG: molybdopterin-dependent oxidoreductase, partial [Arenicellales bacterium]|nr:molybdopterin-dependent oxidoreductase [Arenicellales bacterium]
VKNDISEDWIQVRPNTDVAIMLAMCHILLSEDLHDQAFLDRYTVGFERFEALTTIEMPGNPAVFPTASVLVSILSRADAPSFS